jgi:hypothetical protein
MVLSPEEKKERKRERDRQYYQKNKEKIINRVKEYKVEYNQKNKEAISLQKKEYHSTPKGIKVQTLSSWRRRGIISNDFDTLYDLYINTDKCMYCEKVFADSYERCLDHDHKTGLYRAVLCRSCNVKDVLK